MKFNLLAASILVAGAMAAQQPAFDIKKVNANLVRDVLAGNNNAMQVPLLAANFNKLKAEHLQLTDSKGIRRLIKAVNILTGKNFTDFEKIPTKFFKIRAEVEKLRALSGAADLDAFVALITADQFKEIIKNADIYPELSVESLNNIEATLIAKKKVGSLKNYISQVTVDYLNVIFNADPTDANGAKLAQQARGVAALNKNVIKHLPDNFLNKIVFAPNAADGAFWTDKQLAALKDGFKCQLDITQVSPANFAKYIKNEKTLQRLVKDKLASDDQLSKLGSEGWNKIFANKEGCTAIRPGVKIRDISNVKINSKCFSKLPSKIQSAIVATHKKLDADILSRVTQDMTNNWSYKSASGLEILKYAENKSIIKQLGAHENIESSAHPAHGMDIDAVKEIKVLYENLNAQTIAAMNIDFPSELKEFKKNAEFYCGKEGVVAAVEDLFEEKAEKKKEKEEDKKEGEKKEVIAANFWSTLTKEEAAKFFGTSYSVVTAEMTKESFMQLVANEAALSEVSSASIVQLKSFKELPKEVYAKLGEKAFTAVSADQVESFRLADATDAQVPHISAEAKESFFAKVPAAVLAKNESRFALFTAQQVAAIPAATFKVAVTKNTMPQIKAEATKKITAEQLKTVSADVLPTITAEQVTMIGAEVADEKASGLAVLLANQASLNSEARAALFARVPGSSASRFGVSAAVAAFAALALLA